MTKRLTDMEDSELLAFFDDHEGNTVETLVALREELMREARKAQDEAIASAKDAFRVEWNREWQEANAGVLRRAGFNALMRLLKEASTALELGGEVLYRKSALEAWVKRYYHPPARQATLRGGTVVQRDDTNERLPWQVGGQRHDERGYDSLVYNMMQEGRLEDAAKLVGLKLSPYLEA